MKKNNFGFRKVGKVLVSCIVAVLFLGACGNADNVKPEKKVKSELIHSKREVKKEVEESKKVVNQEEFSKKISESAKKSVSSVNRTVESIMTAYKENINKNLNVELKVINDFRQLIKSQKQSSLTQPLAEVVNMTSLPKVVEVNENKIDSKVVEQIKPVKKRIVKEVRSNGSVLNGRMVSDNREVVLNELIDFGGVKFQSFYISEGRYYSLHNAKGSPVTIFDAQGNVVDKIMKSDTGHNNDVAVVDNLIYIAPGGMKMHVWDKNDDSISTVHFDDIAQYSREHNTRIDVGGIAQSTQDGNKLFLVGLDKHATTAEELEKGSNIIVFTYDKTTGKQDLLLRDELDYIGLLQGATELDGVLYVAQNTKTDNNNLSNYTGITVKAYNSENGSHIDDIQIDGQFEAEGMQVIDREDGTKEIGLGFHSSESEKVISFVPLDQVDKEKEEVIENQEVNTNISTQDDVESKESSNFELASDSQGVSGVLDENISS